MLLAPSEERRQMYVKCLNEENEVQVLTNYAHKMLFVPSAETGQWWEFSVT